MSGITVQSVESSDGYPCLTAAWLLPANATGEDIADTVARLDGAICAHAWSSDLHVLPRKVTGRYYYRTAEEANDSHTEHLTKDLHAAHVVVVRVWRVADQ